MAELYHGIKEISDGTEVIEGMLYKYGIYTYLIPEAYGTHYRGYPNEIYRVIPESIRELNLDDVDEEHIKVEETPDNLNVEFEMVPNQEQVAYKLNSNYFHIFYNEDDGWDYVFTDEKFNILISGVYDDLNISLSDVTDIIIEELIEDFELEDADAFRNRTVRRIEDYSLFFDLH